MRYFILSFVLLISINAFCQKSKMATITFNTMQVKAKGKGMYIEIQKFQEDSGNYVVIKKIKVIKPIFSISMQANDPITCKISLKKSDSSYYDSWSFYITNEPISVLFDTSEVILKSRQNDFYQKNARVYLDMPVTIVREHEFSYSLLKQSYELSLLPRYKYFILELKIKEYENNVIELVKINRSYYRTLTALYNIRDRLTPKTLETCFKILKPVWQGTSFEKKLEEYVAQSKKIFIGKELPNLTLLNKNLIRSQSKDFYSQYDFTFIDLWASWCVPCRAQIKEIKLLYGNMDTTRMQLISVSIDDDKTEWLNAVKMDSITWQNYVDTKGGWEGTVAKNLNLTYIPSNVLVDKTGKIIMLDLSVEQLKVFMDEHSIIKK